MRKPTEKTFERRRVALEKLEKRIARLEAKVADVNTKLEVLKARKEKLVS